MSDRVPLWAGRATALVGIVLVGFTLRLAVAAVSPILGQIEADIRLSSVAVGVLGMLPPVLFAAAGFVAPPIAARLGLERALVLALAPMVVGHVGRAFAGDAVGLAGFTVVVLLGMGVANVLLPPVVRRYFPDRIGLLTALYAGIMSVSTALPALLGAPVGHLAGWRISLGMWGIVCAIALVPWVALAARADSRAARLGPTGGGAAADARDGDRDQQVEEPRADVLRGIVRSRTAWAITATFSVTSLNLYAGFAWLPEIFTELSHVDEVYAGALLAIVGVAGLPGAIVAPLLVARMRNVAPIVLVGLALFVVGYAGLLFAPRAVPWLWALAIGVAPVLFPVCLVLFNARARTHAGTVALSGFGQGVGYTAGALGPLLVGVLHDATGGWVAPILFLTATLAVGVVASIALARPGYVEDEVAGKGPRP